MTNNVSKMVTEIDMGPAIVIERDPVYRSNKIHQKDLKKMLSNIKGERIAILCLRYHYRGILAYSSDNFCILTNATAVEVSGPAGWEKPRIEDPMTKPLVIFYDAIEIIHFPNWIKAPLPGEKDVEVSEVGKPEEELKKLIKSSMMKDLNA